MVRKECGGMETYILSKLRVELLATLILISNCVSSDLSLTKHETTTSMSDVQSPLRLLAPLGNSLNIELCGMKEAMEEY